MEAPKSGSEPSVDFNRVRTSVSRREVELQRIAIEASTAAKSPIAFISILSSDRQRLVVAIGLNADEYPRLELICKRVILQPGDPLVILDTHKNEVYSKFLAVSAPPFVRFYVGIPLVDRAGYALGTLSIANTISQREEPDLTTLKHLAHEAERIIAH
jgi:GAF domain-containing protein